MLIFLAQDISAMVRRAVQQSPMKRYYPDGLERLGGYGIPAAFKRGEEESWPDFMNRSVRT